VESADSHELPVELLWEGSCWVARCIILVMDKIQNMLEYGDVDGLLHILRQERDPALRARAAGALGELAELEASDALTAAALNDPDASVRQAARQALHDLLGNQADMVLRMAESDLQQGGGSAQTPTALIPAEAGVGAVQADHESEPVAANNLADYETLRGLIMIARGDPNHELRLRATKSLGQYADMHAVRELMDLALWDEDDGIRQAAEGELRARFGEQLPEMLESYRQDFEGDEEEEAPWESGIDPYASQPPVLDTRQQPKFEGASTIGCLILVFLVLAAVYLIFR
jgi:HEAT repeat protein